MNDLINFFSTPSNGMGSFFGIVGITIFFIIVTVFLIWKKGLATAIISSFCFGVILLALFMLFHFLNGESLTNDQHNIVDKTREWYSYIGILFVGLIVVVLPFYLFAVITNFVISDNVTKINKKTYGVSFVSLLGLSLFGIIIALIITPLLLLLPNDIFNSSLGNLTNGGEDEGTSFLGFFTKWWLILSVIVVAIYIGIGIRLATKNNNDKRTRIVNAFEQINNVMNRYFKLVITLVPFAILTRLSMLGMGEVSQTTSNLALMGSYLGFWWLGSIIIFALLFLGNFLLAGKSISAKERTRIIVEQSLVSFSTQSTQGSLVQTAKSARELGVSDEISKLTPTKGLIMGMVMCNGFSPMIMMSFVIINNGGGSMDWGLLFLAALLIFTFAISTSGQGSSDYVILTSSFSILGIGAGLYLSILLPIQEFNERTIRTTNNTLGHLLATQITDKYHMKEMKKK